MSPSNLHPIIRLASVIAIISQTALSAQTVNWGATGNFTDTSNTRFFDSTGTPLGSSFTWSVGTFLGSFVPTPDNIGDWKLNWLSLSTDTIDTAIPWNFGGSADVTSNVTDGRLGYIWGYDNINNITQTVLWSGDASEWRFPTFGSFELPPSFSTVNATNVIVGRVDTDLFDNNAGVLGGTGSAFSGTPADPWEIQAAAVPETSSLLIGAVGGLFTLLHRRRR